MPTINSQTIALQLEKVKSKIAIWFASEDSLYSLIKKKAGVEVVSSRNMRIPIQLDGGGGVNQVNMDGGDLGTGSSGSWDVAQVTPVWFVKGFGLTKLAELSTNSDTKAIESLTKGMITDAVTAMKVGLNQLLNTDGSGTLDHVVAVNGTTLTVTNSNAFVPAQTIQVFPALGGVSRGTAVVQGLDANAKTVTFYTLPAGTAANDLLIVNGAPGTAASSLFGLEYINTAATTGTYLNLSRATYPQLRSTIINAANAPLSAAMPRALLNSLKRTLGVEVGDDILFHGGLDVSSAWENLATTISEVIINQVSGDSTQDILKKHSPKTMVGRTLMESINAVPGRLDALDMKTFGRAETAPVGLLEFGGQTLFPQYASAVGQSGGLAANTIGYIASGQQIYCDNPLANGALENIELPANY